MVEHAGFAEVRIALKAYREVLGDMRLGPGVIDGNEGDLKVTPFISDLMSITLSQLAEKKPGIGARLQITPESRERLATACNPGVSVAKLVGRMGSKRACCSAGGDDTLQISKPRFAGLIPDVLRSDMPTEVMASSLVEP
ncbi:hypothetical protein [Paraburkholderia oxyphila]|uniref:hypothetical protein n=1 Tax=Paraburkholderia oxyphila TaxID=614212 RepID=UPI000694B089|nr:hypothetical protein [Paraburkholderia oxyphila]